MDVFKNKNVLSISSSELTKVTWTIYKSGRTVVRAAGSSFAVE